MINWEKIGWALMAILTPVVFLIMFFGCEIGYPDEDERETRLINAMIKVESGGDQNAVSTAGAVGLMQVTQIVLNEYNLNVSHNERYYRGGYQLETSRDYPNGEWIPTDHEDYTMKDMFDPRKNKRVGKWYLNRLKDHYLKDDYTIERLLASYNGGITRFRKLLREGKDWQNMPKESVSYVKKVLEIYNKERIIRETKRN
jgi:soluble lytic murein transglycosylase-like protein